MGVDLKAKAREVSERGFCVIEEAYDEEERDRARRLLDEMVTVRGGHSVEQSVISFHPAFEFGPDLAPFFGKSIIVDAMAEVLQDDVRLVHNGAGVWSNQHAGPSLTQWHVHYAWDVPEGGLQRDVPERVLCNTYLDGSSSAIGPLVVVPRGLNDSLEPFGAVDQPWPGEEHVCIAPGSAVIFDTGLWHCSRRGTNGQLRHLFGGHFQGWSNERPHHADNDCHQAPVESHKEASEVLKRLVDGPAA